MKTIFMPSIVRTFVGLLTDYYRRPPSRTFYVIKMSLSSAKSDLGLGGGFFECVFMVKSTHDWR
jgi:hypothetical protein